MAVVFDGVHRSDQHRVAIKIVTAQKARQQRYRRAFRNEVRSVARLNHPNIIEVFDVGELDADLAPDAETQLIAGSPYLVMQHVAGGTLSGRAPELQWPEVKRFLMSILDALAHAHARRVIHRDLKPDNVLVDVDERGQWQPRLTDFGIARALDKETFEGKADVDEWITGTPKYMAPEAIRGRWREQGPWTDLYGLGCIAWWLSVGHPPFWRGGTTRILQDHVYTPPPRLDAQIAVPEGFESWLWKMLAKDPAERFQRAADAAYGLMGLGEASAGKIWSARPAAGADDELQDAQAADDGPTIVDARPFGADPSAHRELDLSGKQRPLAPQRTAHGGQRPKGAGGPRHESAMHPDASALRPGASAAILEARPRIFPSWRHGDDAPAAAMKLTGAGLGLYGLRAIPMVARGPSRTLIWDTLKTVQAEASPRLLVVQGPLGSGKSRLCEWMCQRAHELGCAEYLKATHSPAKGPLDGLGPMLARFFRCAGQQPDDVLATIQQRLRWIDADGPRDEYVARAAASIVLESDADADISEAGSPTEFGSPRERYASVERLFRILARRRPVMVWLDDAHHSAEALDFAAHLLDGGGLGELPVLILITARPDVIERQSHMGEKLDALLDDQRAQAVELGPLEAADHRQLVQTLLGLDSDLVEEVASRTEGNPLFAVQLVGDWVERGVLEAGRHGFVLRDDVEAPIPDDIYQVWAQRLDSVLGRFDEPRRQEVQLALELGAVLGVDVSTLEWRNACALSQLSPPEDLLDLLYTLRLARPSQRGWSFTHGLLAESLQRSASEAGRLERHHTSCAEMLAATYHASTRGIAERRARHLLAADRPSEALQPLYEAARSAERVGEYELALRLLDDRRQAIESLGLDARGERMAENASLRVRIGAGHGTIEGAEATLEWVEAAAREHGWTDVLSQVLVTRSMFFRREGQMKRSLEVCEQALELFSEQDSEQRANILAGKGFTHVRLGEHELALECFEEATRCARRVGDDRLVLRCMVNRFFINIQRGHWEQARRDVRRAQDMAAATGMRADEGHCWNALGEIARFEKDWAQARTHYTKAAEIWTSIGHLNGHVARCNLAMVELADGNYDRAVEALREVRPAYAWSGYEVGLPLVDLGLATCAAARGDWGEFDTRVSRAESGLERTGRVDREVAWLADLAADVVDPADYPARKTRLEDIAQDQWDRLDSGAE